MTKEELLNTVEMSEEYICKSKMTMGNKYRITLERNNNSMEFDFHTNAYDEVKLEDIVECLMMDRETFLSMAPNYWTVDYFRREFCYSEDHMSDEQLEKIMKDIEKNSKNLEELFTEEELDILAQD